MDANISKEILIVDPHQDLLEEDFLRPEDNIPLWDDTVDPDPESEEYTRLRCSSIQTEVINEKQKRKNRTPSAGYPGLAFGSSIFSSGTLMKFNIISNELHNIQNVQLKRV